MNDTHLFPFPCGEATDLVSKVRSLAAKVTKWVDNAKELFESGQKIPFQKAKALLDAGEKLKVNIDELKKLKAAFKAAQDWSDEARNLSVENGSIHVNEVKQLIEEHDSLLIGMPDEVEELKQAVVGYCICRRPYDGFMIGCDHCEVSRIF
jgi:hypothetical protein